jgi:hypothetical protein
MVRSTEGEGDRVGTLYDDAQATQKLSVSEKLFRRRCPPRAHISRLSVAVSVPAPSRGCGFRKVSLEPTPAAAPLLSPK